MNIIPSYMEGKLRLEQSEPVAQLTIAFGSPGCKPYVREYFPMTYSLLCEGTGHAMCQGLYTHL